MKNFVRLVFPLAVLLPDRSSIRVRDTQSFSLGGIVRANKLIRNCRLPESNSLGKSSVNHTQPEIKARAVVRSAENLNLARRGFHKPLHFNAGPGTVIKLPVYTPREARF